VLKLVGNCAFIVVLTVLTMLSSCLKRPEKRAPRLDLRSDTQPAVPVASDCASLDPAARALRRECQIDPDPLVTPERRKTTTEPKTTEADPDEEVDEEEEVVEEETPELDNNRTLATISVGASCDTGSLGCLYRGGDSKKYWLNCEIKAGGCKNGFAVEVETAGSPQVTRGSVCRDGDKTIADLSQGEIKLECKTDRRVTFSLTPKKAELSLHKSHVANRHICVTTQAGKGYVADFNDARLNIAAGDCPNDGRNRFNMQLEFSW